MDHDLDIRKQIIITDDVAKREFHIINKHNNLELAVRFSKNKINLQIFEKLLLKINNDTNKKKILNGLLRTTILYEKETASLDAIKLLIQHGADVNYTDYHCWFPLVNCCIKPINNIETIEFLIESGVYVNSKSNQNQNALMHLVMEHSENLEIFKLLIRKGIQINCKDINNNTALMICFKSEKNKLIRYDIIKLLLDNKADIYIKNDEGKNIFDIVKDAIGENTDIYSLIVNYKNLENDHLCESDINFIYNYSWY